MKNFVALSVGTLALTLACGGGGKNVKPGGGGDDTPAWVSQGSGAFAGESGKKLQGVGVQQGKDAQARRQAADAKAHDQLTAGVGALASGLAKVTESTRDNVGEEIKGIAGKAAAAAQHAKDHWVTPDGAESALDQIDLAAFKQALQSVDGDDGVKREMANNADRAFDQLAKQ